MAKFFPLDLTKFKRISSDKHTTTLEHPDGHRVTVAHSALSPKLRSNLAELPMHPSMAKGGEVKQSNPKLEESKKLPPKMAQGGKIEHVDYSAVAKEGNTIPDPAMDAAMDKADADDKARKMAASQPQKLADGGEIPAPSPSPTTEEEQQEADQKDIMRPRLMANGGDPSDFTPDVAPQAMAPSAIAAPTTEAQDAANEGQSAPGADPDTARLRQLYNDQMRVSTGKGQAVVPGATFGIDGKPPETFNPEAWTTAEKLHAGEKAQQQVDQSSASSKIVADNAVRQRAGLPPIEMPQGQAPEAGTPAEPGQSPQVSAQAPQGVGNDPYGTEATMGAFTQGLRETKAGLAGEAKAIGAQGQQEAQVLENRAAEEKSDQADYQSNYNQIDGMRNELQEAIRNQKINPRNYIDSMTTGGRITTALGLILGGMGGGLTHQGNPALDFLNKQIDRDIQSQQAELGKKENLLAANMKQFGNLRDATDATRIMKNDMVSFQMKQIASRTQDQLAKSRMLQAAGKIDMDTAQMQGSMAMRRTLLGGVTSGQVDPAKVVNLLIPEGQRAEANKELASAMQMTKSRDNVLSALDQVAKLNTVGNNITSPLQTPRQVAAIVEPLVAQISKETAGRFTEQDANMLRNLFSKMGSNAQTNQIQRAQALKILNEKMNFPILQTYGINVGNIGGRFNTQGASRLPPLAPPIKK